MATYVSVPAPYTLATYRKSQQFQASRNRRRDHLAHFRLSHPHQSAKASIISIFFIYLPHILIINCRKEPYISAFMHTYPKSHVKAALLLSVFLTVVITALPAHQSESPYEAPASLQLETPEATDFASVNKPVAKQQDQVKASNSQLDQPDHQTRR